MILSDWLRSAETRLVAAGVGGLIGSELGSKRLDNVVIKRVLAVVLLVAGIKLLLV